MRTRPPRIRGRKPHPSGRITAAFEDVIVTSSVPNGTLAAIAGFPSNKFSSLLYDSFALTPLTMQRLRVLALALHFEGDVVEPLR